MPIIQRRLFARLSPILNHSAAQNGKSGPDRIPQDFDRTTLAAPEILRIVHYDSEARKLTGRDGAAAQTRPRVGREEGRYGIDSKPETRVKANFDPLTNPA